MELSGMVYPPNRPLERTMKPSQVPVLYDFLFFIEANKNGEIILGSSNVAGTYWEGTLFHYKDFEFATNNIYNSYFISNSTVSDAKFIQNNYVLLAEDNGHLKLLNVPEDGQQAMECKYDLEKDGGVTQLTVWDNNKFATCTGACINLYNVNESSIQSNVIFRNYHTDTIFSIDANKLDENLFMSASADGKACIWDRRLEIPATVIYNNEFSSLTSVAWNSLNTDYLIIGSETGDIYLLDIKKPNDVLCTIHCFNSGVHKVCFNNNSELLGVCGNIPNVLIYNCKDEQFKKSYENAGYNTVVRGLTWYRDNLYSCGFNKKLISHCC